MDTEEVDYAKLARLVQSRDDHLFSYLQQFTNAASLDFLLDETRRREDILDDTIDAVSRKAYYTFTLATSVFAVYLAGIEDVLASLNFANGPTFSTATGLAGFLFYMAGIGLFWDAHSGKSYKRVPHPDVILRHLPKPLNDLKLTLGIARSQAIANNLAVADHVGRVVNAQHDIFLLQVTYLVLSWVLFHTRG